VQTTVLVALPPTIIQMSAKLLAFALTRTLSLSLFAIAFTMWLLFGASLLSFHSVI